MNYFFILHHPDFKSQGIQGNIIGSTKFPKRYLEMTTSINGVKPYFTKLYKVNCNCYFLEREFMETFSNNIDSSQIKSWYPYWVTVDNIEAFFKRNSIDYQEVNYETEPIEVPPKILNDRYIDELNTKMILYC